MASNFMKKCFCYVASTFIVATVSFTFVSADDFCTLPKETGRCRAIMPKYYFNKDKRRCELFNWGGCGGNENRFGALKDCHESCKHLLPDPNDVSGHVRSEHCLLPPLSDSTRTCYGYFPRFTFNSKSLKCEQYIYGGCLGTKNLFLTEQECKTTCLHNDGGIILPGRKLSFQAASTPEETTPETGNNVDVEAEQPAVDQQPSEDICTLPPILPGQFQCTAFIPKWTFDKTEGGCIKYTYGGCRGTKNLFDTKEDCEAKCPSSTQAQKQLPVVEQPDVEDVCSLTPILPGQFQCTAFIPKWTFDKDQGGCIQYTYGGCRGTKNLFDTKEDCEAKCPSTTQLPKPSVDKQTDSEDICSLSPLSPGLIQCTAYIPKWTYDKDQGGCIKYTYGGCRGTKNLFDSKEDCEARCSSTTSALSSNAKLQAENCGLPIATGPCKGFFIKFGFNKETNRCTKFVYGGCQGNSNKFDTLEECVNVCGGHDPQENLVCEASNCNTQEEIVYKAKGCQPIIKKGECCPSSWDCCAWDERVLNLDKCFWANEENPRGKYYEQGENVPEASDVGQCRLGCRCSKNSNGNANIMCASPGCYWPGIQKRGESCAILYSSANSCCPTATKCGAELKDHLKCELDGKTYYEGQKMYPKSDPCKMCFCNDRWTGDLNNRESCYNNDCGLNYRFTQKMKDGCQPVFKEGVCCPIDWICPEKKVITNNTTEYVSEVSQMVICPEGVAIRPGKHLLPLLPPKEDQGARGSQSEVSSEPSDVCLLPRTLGPCEGFRDAWYFDLDSRRCLQFKTGGPGSGGNLFETEAECKTTCSKYSVDESRHCKEWDEKQTALPLIMCLSEHKRFRFNKKSGQCEEYLDKTCGRFTGGYTSMDECKANCLEQPNEVQVVEVNFEKGKDEKCNQAPEVGPCRSRMSRFYYDTQTGKCNKFWYGGCRGNENNFKDERNCIETCVPDNKLSKAIYLQDLEVQSPCKQAGAVMGPCRARIPRFYYDSATQTCKMFFFGGCLGNDNNFISLKECTSTCPVNPESQQNRHQICQLPKQAGNCRAIKKRFYFDPESGKCQPFDYSGCSGNENNFESLDNCRLECQLPTSYKTHETSLSPVSSPDVTSTTPSTNLDGDLESNEIDEDPCLQEKEVGMCRAAFKRFYFDKNTKECKKFIYGGCQGNKNNFATSVQCEEQCEQHMNKIGLGRMLTKPEVLPNDPVCLLPVEEGPCRALRPAFFFNTQTRRCQQFMYGGCKGNQNRFATKEECEAACPIPDQIDAQTLKTVSLPRPKPKCQFGDEIYNLGDLIRFENNKCRTCRCVAPPGIVCMEKMCERVDIILTGNSICESVFDEDGCCQTGYNCKPKADEPSNCSERTCINFDIRVPPNHTCRSVSDGCCQAGVICTPNEFN